MSSNIWWASTRIVSPSEQVVKNQFCLQRKIWSGDGVV